MGLPARTVTLVFTDIEGSTRLLQELGGERYRQALAVYRELVREAFARFDGVEVDAEGDSFFYVFQSALNALEAAQEARSSLASHFSERGVELSIRTGIHTGEPQFDPPRYVGIDVHRAARIMQAAHGGQIVLSQATEELLDERFSLRSLGEHHLKDLLQAEHLYQLGQKEFPPLHSLNVSNLPTPATPLLGREWELRDLLSLLSDPDVRLLTLTGAGGSGKTRLALEAAAEVVPVFGDGAFWVDLAPLRDSNLVLPLIAQALGAKGELSSYIVDRRLLVLLDNLERLLEAGPELAALLSACPNLTLLCTSREPLHLQGEREFPVPPLQEQAAVALFVERARAVQPHFEANGPIAEICRRLDNLPLAVELAAARVKLLPPKTLLDRLEQRLPLLTGGARNLPERQQTLRATIEWSHELLQEGEKRLFARMSVFRGGCRLEGAEQVCGAELDTLFSLVDKSLVLQREESEGEPRFSMLETIREYAHEKLDASGEAQELRRRHAHYVLSLVEQADFRGPQQQRWLDRFRVEHDNLRTALDWLEAAGDVETSLRLANRAARFWWLQGHFGEGRTRLERMLAAGEWSATLRAETLVNLSSLAQSQGDSEPARQTAEEALELYESLGDKRGTAHALTALGNVSLRDAEATRRAHTRALALFREVGDRRMISVGLTNLCNLALSRGEYAAAEGQAREVLALGEEIDDKQVVAIALVNLGQAVLGQNRPEEAGKYLSRSLALAREVQPRLVVDSQIGLAGVLAARDPEAAVRILGAAEAIADSTEFTIGLTERKLREQTLAICRETLGEERLTQVREHGRRMSLNAAVDYALERVHA